VARIVHADGITEIVRDERIEISPGDKIKVGKLHFAEIVGPDERKPD
jgi:hypothetical protein